MATDVVLTAGTNVTIVPDDIAHKVTINAAALTGPTGPQGAQGPPGPTAVSADAGNQAVLGTDSLILVPQTASGGMSQGEWLFSTTTSAPPSSGQIRLNNSTQSAATAMYISNVTAPGIDAGNMLRFGIVAGSKLVLQEKNNSANYAEYTVSAAPIVQSGYLEVPIAFVVGGGIVPAQRCLLIVIAPSGDVTSARTLSAGAGLTGGGDLSANRTFDVGAGTGITVAADSVGLTVPVAIANGGTNATTAAAARVSLVGAVNAQTGTTYTFVLADAETLVTFNNAAAVTVTLPLNSSVAFAVGAQIDIASLGAGKVTISPAGGVTLNSVSGNKALGAQYAGGTLKKLATDTWLLIGNLQA